MPYLKLLQGRSDLGHTAESREEDGPLLGPFDFVETSEGREVRLGEQEGYVLQIVGGLVYYAGCFYRRWSVISGTINPLVHGRLTAFDPGEAVPPDHVERCDCEEPGYFCCGVPGVLAHLENGKVVPDFQVERCDACRCYESDAAAEAKLRELGLFSAGDPRSLPPDGPLQDYSVHCYATVRVKLPGIPASSPLDAARRAAELFNWDRHQGQAEFADEISEFLVDRDGDEDYARSVRFDGDFNELRTAAYRGAPWLLVINNGSYERIEVCSSHESGFRLLHEYVHEQWEGTFGEEPIDADPQAAVQRFFDVGPVSYTLEERTPL